MQKIILITDHHDFGGVAEVHYNLAKGFIERGYNVTLVSAFLERVGKPIPEGIEHRVLNSKSWERKLFLPYLLRLSWFLSKNRDVDLIVSAKDHVNIFVILAAKLAKLKSRIICNSHNTVSEISNKLNWRGYRKLLSLCKMIYPYGDIIANVSEGSAQDSMEFFGLNKVHYLPNPVVGDEADDKPYTSPFSVKGAVNILACGRLAAQKNYPLMIEAFSLALKEEESLHLTILGNGEERAALEQLAKDLDVHESITFQGFVDNPRPYMQHAECLWLTSHYEGFGMVLIEALAEGCPVISTNCPHGPAEIIGDNRYGVLVNSYAPQDNADALLAFIRQPRKSKEFYKSRAKDFSIATCTQKYLELVGL